MDPRHVFARPDARSSTAIFTRNVAPWPTPPLDASIVPPCISVSWRAIDSPRPSPPRSRAMPASAWRNRSKTCGRNSGAMPMPVSLTATSTCELTRSSRTCTLPPRFVNLTAFDSRFHSTCCSRSGSPEIGRRLRIEHGLDAHTLRLGGRRDRVDGTAHDRRESPRAERSAGSCPRRCARCRARPRRSASATSRCARSSRWPSAACLAARCRSAACARSRGSHSAACAARATGWPGNRP